VVAVPPANNNGSARITLAGPFRLSHPST
jgi:hypothetical protein